MKQGQLIDFSSEHYQLELKFVLIKMCTRLSKYGYMLVSIYESIFVYISSCMHAACVCMCAQMHIPSLLKVFYDILQLLSLMCI